MRLLISFFIFSNSPLKALFQIFCKLRYLWAILTFLAVFADACQVINVTFQNIEKSLLVRLLGGVSGEFHFQYFYSV